jgi:hypothetical protein
MLISSPSNVLNGSQFLLTRTSMVADWCGLDGTVQLRPHNEGGATYMAEFEPHQRN